MSKILLFIHGTGVRREAYDVSFKLIQQKLAKHQCEVSLEECYWGDDVGVLLSEDCKSVPRYGSTRGVGTSEADQELALWTHLAEDPTFELSLLSLGGGKAQAYPIHQAHPGQQLATQFAELTANPDLTQAISSLNLQDSAKTLLEIVSKSAAFEAATKSAVAATPQHRSALARAVVAALQSRATAAGLPVYDRTARNELVVKLEQALGNDARGIIGTLVGWYGRANRGKLTDNYYAQAGDILRYQAHGDEWRSFIDKRIAQFPNDKVIILAHSLGGIAAFETIFQRKPANVAKLITYGSQAPFFYELDALVCMRRGVPLPANFPPWTNFYDLNDPLSYLAQGVFGKQVADHEVQSGQAPLAAHSSYLFNEPFWQLLSSKINLV